MRKIFCKDCGRKYGFYYELSPGSTKPSSYEEKRNTYQRREVRRAKVRKEAEEKGLELIAIEDGPELIEITASRSFTCPKGHKLSLDDVEDNNS